MTRYGHWTTDTWIYQYLDYQYLELPIPGYGRLQWRNLLVSIWNVPERLPDQYATFSIRRAEVTVTAYYAIHVLSEKRTCNGVSVRPSVCLSVCPALRVHQLTHEEAAFDAANARSGT